MGPEFGGNSLYDIYSIYSISFIWVLPIVIGLTPLIVAPMEVLSTWWKPLLYPFLSELVFFLLALGSGLEDLICLIIIIIPFLIGAAVVGGLLAPILRKFNSKKLYSVLILPLVLSLVESLLPNQVGQFTVTSKIEIDAGQALVWQNLVEVPEIAKDEYILGFYNRIGVPRPVKSELLIKDGVEYRIGYFSDDLELWETVAHKDSLNSVSFAIHIDKSKLRDVPTDKYILRSENFSFNEISYALKPTLNGGTELYLSCNYTIDSKMNGYANFWASQIVRDFEERLLHALKLKLERV